MIHYKATESSHSNQVMRFHGLYGESREAFDIMRDGVTDKRELSRLHQSQKKIQITPSPRKIRSKLINHCALCDV